MHLTRAVEITSVRRRPCLWGCIRIKPQNQKKKILVKSTKKIITLKIEPQKRKNYHHNVKYDKIQIKNNKFLFIHILTKMTIFFFYKKKAFVINAFMVKNIWLYCLFLIDSLIWLLAVDGIYKQLKLFLFPLYLAFCHQCKFLYLIYLFFFLLYSIILCINLSTHPLSFIYFEFAL